MIPKGKYRNYCVIESATRTSDSQGGWTLAWATAGSDWFRAIPVSQSRTLDQGGVKYVLAVEFFQSKYGFALTTDHRIVWNSQNYTIHSIVPSEKLDENKIIAYV
jgi:head-tail adaptor